MKLGSHHKTESIAKLKEKRKLQVFTEETKDKMRLNRLNWKWSDDVKMKMSETRKRLVQERPDLREVAKKIGLKNKGRVVFDKTRITEANRKNNSDPVVREKFTKGLKNWWASATTEEKEKRLNGLRSSYTPKRNLKISKVMKKFWSNPENAKLRFEQIGIKPNNLELRFQKFLDEHFPNEWKYVGDGQIWIAGKCPDFWNMNGRKSLIELFGSYFHKPEDEEIRKSHFGKYGYETIVVWDHELNNKPKLLEKLTQKREVK